MFSRVPFPHLHHPTFLCKDSLADPSHIMSLFPYFPGSPYISPHTISLTFPGSPCISPRTDFLTFPGSALQTPDTNLPIFSYPGKNSRPDIYTYIIYTYIYIYTYISIYIYIYIYICNTYIYIYIYTHTHTYKSPGLAAGRKIVDLR